MAQTSQSSESRRRDKRQATSPYKQCERCTIVMTGVPNVKSAPRSYCDFCWDRIQGRI